MECKDTGASSNGTATANLPMEVQIWVRGPEPKQLKRLGNWPKTSHRCDS